MKVLIAIPHVFNPIEGSIYSSQKEHKRNIKKEALMQATEGNLIKHGLGSFIHTSSGLGTDVFTKGINNEQSVDLSIQVYTPKLASLSENISLNSRINIIDIVLEDYTKIPLITSQKLLEQADNYDIICYMEDDIVIEDRDFFNKIIYLDKNTNGDIAFMPHRCENIPGKGEVILSGDPEGGRPDLFWDTGERINIKWPLGDKQFYRATNPHSGCYFLTRRQALTVRNYWMARNWIAEYELSGPLEQAGSGLLLPILKIMKPIPSQYRFLMVHHLDELWKRHPFK